MNQIEQLKVLLAGADFWQLEHVKSNTIQMQGGTSIELFWTAGRLQWKAIWPDSSETKSDKTFTRWQDAKLNLRDFLTKRLMDLVDAATPPAKIEVNPV